MFRIALLGCGNFADFAHGPALTLYRARHPDTVLTACCDRGQQKARRFAEKFGFLRAYTDAETMLRMEQPDAVCLVVRPEQTAATAERILELGYPIIMEKPPGLNRAEALRIADAADRSGKTAAVAFNRRHMPLVEATRKTIRSLGGASYVGYDFLRSGRTEEDFASTAIHAVDTVCALADSDVAGAVFRYRGFPDRGIPAVNVHMDADLTSGTIARVNAFPAGGAEYERVTVDAGGHTLLLRLPVCGGMDYPGALEIYRDGCLCDIQNGDAAENYTVTLGFYRENETFFESVRTGDPCACTVRACMRSADIADHIRRGAAAYENTPQPG